LLAVAAVDVAILGSNLLAVAVAKEVKLSMR
jgi:hypothetical protein